MDPSKLGMLKLEVPINYTRCSFQALAPKVYQYSYEYKSKKILENGEVVEVLKKKEKRAFKGMMGELRHKVFEQLSTHGVFLPDQEDKLNKWQSSEGRIYILQ